MVRIEVNLNIGTRPMNASDLNLKISLNRDIVDFAKNHKFSQREIDVFLLLLNRISTSSGIAEYLGLSANTVSNHLKSILTKSRCHSKTELLGQFLEFQTLRTEAIQAFVRRPRVVIVEHASNDAAQLADALQKFGLEVYTAPHVSAPKAVLERRAEAVIYQCAANANEGVEFFQSLRRDAAIDANMFLIVPDDIAQLDSHVFDEVTEIFSFNQPPAQVALAVLEHGIPDPYILNRFVRTQATFEATVDGKLTGTAENIGYGGLFINLDTPALSALSKKKKLEVQFTLPDGQTFSIESRVAWVRAQPRTFFNAGIGVQFLRLDRETSHRIKQFVRIHKSLPKLD